MVKELLILYLILCTTTDGKVETWHYSQMELWLKSAEVNLYSSDIHLYLIVETKEAILYPELLTTAFKCTLTGRHLLSPQTDLPISKSNVTSFPYGTYSGAKIVPDENFLFKHKYVLVVTSHESGYVRCQDNLKLGLRSDYVPHTAGYRSSVVARFQVKSISGAVEVIKEHESMPSLILVDSDKIGDPELTVRFESRLPNQEDQLLEYATELVREHNFTVNFMRGSRYCLSENEGNFTWPITKVGRRAVPVEPCVDEKGLLGPSRRCIGNQLEGAYWEPVITTSCTPVSSLSKTLLDSVHEEDPDALLGIREMIGKEIYLSEAQIHMASIGLNMATKKSGQTSKSAVLEIVDSVLDVENEVLKKLAMTSSSLETILDILGQIPSDSHDKRLNPTIRKRILAVSFNREDSHLGFAVSRMKNVTLFGEDESLQSLLKKQPDVVVYRKEDSKRRRMEFLVMENDALFRSFDQRTRVIGPVVGIGINDEDRGGTLLIVFKMGGNNSTAARCAAWNPRSDADWSRGSAVVTSGFATEINGNETMRICVYNVMHIGFIFFAQVYEEKAFASNLFGAQESMKPKIELRYNKRTSDTFLTVKMYADLEVRGPVIDALECSMTDLGNSRYYSLGLDINKKDIFHERTNLSSEYSNEWKIFEISNMGHGILSCRDKLGLGLESNDVLVTNQNTAVVIFERGTLDNLEEFAFVYPFKYGRKYKLSVSLRAGDDKNILLRFHQFSEKNHTKFLRALEELSYELEADYNWRKLYVRSTQECPAVKDNAWWPKTPGNNYAFSLNPAFDDHGRLYPRRLCLGNHEDGFFWDEEPYDVNVEDISLDRIHLLKLVAKEDNKIEALNNIAKIISDIGDSKLNVAEMWLVLCVLRDAANEVVEKGSEFQYVMSLCIIVDFMHRSRHYFQYLAANLITLSVREHINILLASSAIFSTVSITKPNFSAFATSLNEDNKGIEIYQSQGTLTFFPIPGGNLSEVQYENSSIQQGIMVAAAYIKSEILKNLTMVVTIFKDDFLFYPPIRSELEGPVLGVSLYSRDELLEYDKSMEIMILLEKKLADYTKESCHLWNDNLNEGWSNIGCENFPQNFTSRRKDMTGCICTHATYFASITHLPYTSFDMIPVFGCYIASFPNIIILIIIFSKRKNLVKQLILLLQITLVYFIQLMTFTALFSNKTPTIVSVTKLGIFLAAMVQFCFLASFLWDFIFIFHSTLNIYYHKLCEARDVDRGNSLHDRERSKNARKIKILKKILQKYYVVVASICGWLIPFIITLLTVAVHFSHSSLHQYERVPWSIFYYPVGFSLYICVFLPLFLISLNVVAPVFLHKNENCLIQFIIPTFRVMPMMLFWIFGLYILFSSPLHSPIISILFLVVAILYGVWLLLQTVFFSQTDNHNEDNTPQRSETDSPNPTNTDEEMPLTNLNTKYN